MKRILAIFLGLALFSTSFAGTNVVTPTKPSKLNANQIMLPLGKNGEQVSLMDLSRMKVKELEALTGHKMNLANKLSFKIAQGQLRNSIATDGTVNSKKLEKAMKHSKADNSSIPKGLYIVLAIFGLAWIAMGVMDNWSGNNWWVNLILTLLFWLPGFIHALIKMKDYYQ